MENGPGQCPTARTRSLRLAADLSDLERELQAAERRLATVTTPESIDALGAEFATVAARYRDDRDAAAQALGEARAQATRPAPWRPLTLPTDVAAAREVLAAWFGAVSIRRTDAGTEVQLWERPDVDRVDLELPTRGYRRSPGLVAFPTADAARAEGVTVLVLDRAGRPIDLVA